MTHVAEDPRILLLPGDGIGPEVMAEGRRVLDAVATKFNHRFVLEERLIGGAAIDACGVGIRDEDIAVARVADGILFGAAGGPKWDNPHAPVRPERGLLKLRKALQLYANLRPVAVSPSLSGASSLKPEVVAGTDLLILRELTGGLYFGRPSRQWRERRGRAAVDTLIYREHEIVRIARLAFELARGRKSKVTSVDKANVLSSSRLWRSVVMNLGEEYPDVEVEHLLVDAMTMHLIQRPASFDVVLTENMFGDILSDEASVLAGSLGLLPSASLGAATQGGRRLGLYEPIHGSAPDIAGQGRANPIGMILSVALMLRWSLGMEPEAGAIENSVAEVLAAGIRTGDIAGDGATASTEEVGRAVAERIAG
jgi:3-isopropylmalate dehydrogenase